jgi:hypothetical protein
MTTCIICRFEVEKDDVVIGGANGRGVCLRCYARETATQRPMPKALRNELIAALASTETV